MKLSEQASSQLKQLGQIIGTMIVTRSCYAHDGLDTSAIDQDIKDLQSQLDRSVKLHRAYLKRELEEQRS